MRRVIILMAVVAAGLALALYPQMSVWLNSRELAQVNAAYLAAVRNTSEVMRAQTFREVDEYNNRLAQKSLHLAEANAAASDIEYNELLHFGDNPLMGEVVIPKIEVRLGIYHGTSDSVLARGAGHLYGTSLPVGGPNTHAALSAHSGYERSEMFGRLPELTFGDEFYLSVAGRNLRYEVDDIQIVEPSDTGALSIIPDGDYVTLVTCTPPGINSHRLLVRGVRTELPIAAGIGAPVSDFPWFLVQFASGITGAGILTAIVERRRKQVLATFNGATRQLGVSQVNYSGKDSTVNLKRLPRHAAALGIGILLVVGVSFGGTATAYAAGLPSPLPTASDSGTLVVIKSQAPINTQFTVTPVTAISGTTVNLTTAAGWNLISTFDVTNIGSATLGTPTTKATNSVGAAGFDLAPGLYYVTEVNSGSVLSDPFLVTIPSQDPITGAWSYQINASAKAVPIVEHTPTPTPTPTVTPTITPISAPVPTGVRGLLTHTGVWLGPLFVAVAAAATGIATSKRKAGNSR